ncbi:MAG TPA: hypothetical protein DCS93_03685 [Microscillaceae bacterium]|nr:hypothetical protein [Microscillaceae bacterium]
MNKINFIRTFVLLLSASFVFQACTKDEDTNPTLQLPTSYTSADFATNVTAETTVRTEIGTLTSEINTAESNAGTTTVAAIAYPSNLKAVTLPSYATKVETWLGEIVKAANSGTAFMNPGTGTPTGDGGKLGSRLLDENGLELEQMVQKGSFGAALYNHALTVINGTLTAASTDKLIEILGTDITFDPEKVTNAATYVRRRSDITNSKGFLFDMRDNLIKAKAAIEGGSAFDTDRDAALAEFKLNWEKSNFATVIYYCNNAKTKLQSATTDAERGDALHSYAEGVAFAAGWLGISDKKITDAQIEEILTNLLAPSTGTPTSYKFLNDATLLANFDATITLIKGIYGFTDTEVTGFYTNN